MKRRLVIGSPEMQEMIREFDPWWEKLKASRYDWNSIRQNGCDPHTYSVIETMAKAAAWEAWILLWNDRKDRTST